MNRNFAAVVVVLLIFAMVGTIAWNEYLAGNKGAWERGGMGTQEQDTSMPSLLFATNTSITLPPHTPQLPPSPALPSTHTPTYTYTDSPTLTPTPSPTVTILLMQVTSQFGVNLRDAPGGEVIQGLIDGALVQPYPGSEKEIDGLTWLHVVTLDGVEGWLATDFLSPASVTSTVTP